MDGAAMDTAVVDVDTSDIDNSGYHFVDNLGGVDRTVQTNNNIATAGVIVGRDILMNLCQIDLFGIGFEVIGTEPVTATANSVDTVHGVVSSADFGGVDSPNDTVDDSRVMTVELVLGAYTVSQFVHG